MSATAGGSLRLAWRHRQFRPLVAAYGVSGVGDLVFTVALIAYVLDRTGSAGWVSATVIVRLVPLVVFGPIGGVLAGRFDRRVVMVVSDVVRAAVMVALAVAAALQSPALPMLVLAFLNNVATAPWRPAAVAATPAVVGEQDLAAANAVEATISQIALFAGPALGAVLYALTSAEVAFVVNGASFLASAALISTVSAAGRPPKTVDTSTSAPGDAPPRASWRTELASGVMLIRDTPGLVLVQLLIVSVLFAYGFELVVHSLIAERQLGIGAEGAGYLIGAVGVGGLFIAPFSGRIAASPRAGAALAISAILLGAPLALLAVVRSPFVAVAMLLVEGVGYLVFEVVAITFLQRLLAGDDLARVFGLQDSLGAAATLTGALLSPVLVDTVGLSATVVIGGGLLVLFGFLVAGPLDRLGHRLAAEVAPLNDIVEALSALELFEGASRAALERLAGTVTTEEHGAGTSIVEEGAPPDDVFVVRAGDLVVTSSRTTAPFPMLRAGDWFGEIGVVRGMPRNATVTSSSDVTVWRIPGAAFTEALTTIDAPPTGLERGIAARVAPTPSRDGYTTEVASGTDAPDPAHDDVPAPTRKGSP